MTERVEMIWEFRGPQALPTAEHHKLHLEEFIQKEMIAESFCELNKYSDQLVTVSLVTPMSMMDDLRQRLKPHKGRRYTE